MKTMYIQKITTRLNKNKVETELVLFDKKKPHLTIKRTLNRLDATFELFQPIKTILSNEEISYLKFGRLMY